MKNYYLLPALSSNPQILRRTLALVPSEALTQPTHPDRFSPLEVICHLADWEPIMREERMKVALNAPESSFLAYDEAVMAVENNYAGRDMNQQLELFAAERARTVEFVKSLSDSDWANTAYHPERGIMSLFELIHMVVCHDIYHVNQLWAAIPQK